MSAPFGVVGDQACDASVLLDELGRVGLHAQVECFVTLALLGEEIQEVPLWHQGHEFAVRRQMAEIRHWQVFRANLRG